jgi:F-type H+-transporting ATPase subunit epsilon
MTVTEAGSHRLAVSLVAADRRVWTGTAAMVVARTTEGDVGVLPGHQPILSILLPSVLMVRGAEGDGSAGDDLAVVISGGFVSVAGNKVSILAESVLLPSEIDTAAAEALLREARAAEGSAGSDKAVLEQAEADIRFAEAQLRVASGGAGVSGH